jgi:membrane-associated phospholipid phosphatase/predicted MFS family arabinose efflux permease
MTSLAVALETRPPMRRLRMPFLVAFAAAALAAGLGRAVTTSYLPLLLERIDDAPGLIGMVMLVNAAAGMAVPLVTGLWSDRLQRSGRGRRMPFVIGGSIVTAGGLLAIALGFATSYLVLALLAAVVYTGLNALTTAHRALVPETFDETGRARATSAQELAMLGGGLVGLALGGLLFGIAPWAPFALSAVLVPLLAAPTISRVREPRVTEDDAVVRSSYPATYYLDALRRPGVGAFLLAQILWVLGYAALPAFFLLYAEDVLSLEPGVASLWLAGFGLATGAAIALAGRVRNPALHRPLLLVGVVLLGGGFLGVAASTSLPLVGASLVVGATGFGLVSTLGFPLFSSLIPPGEAGGYTALYFSVRAISSTIALPAAGWTVAATGSYRALFVLGGVATLTALLPLVGVRRPRGRRWKVAALLATVPVLGVLVAQTAVGRLDEALFGAINALGPGPELVWTILDPHTRNYIVLILVALGAGALSSPSRVPVVLVRVLGSALLAWGLLEALYAVYDRPRPEEVLSGISLNEHSWAHLNSFPSGHLAITAALAVATALLFPRLAVLAYAYVAVVAFTRVLFGAHFPLDAVAGTALGVASALLVAVAVERLAGRAAAPSAVEPLPADARVVAVMPAFNHMPPAQLVESTLAEVDRLVIVDDGSDPDVASALDTLATAERVELLRLPIRTGKGSAVRAGVEHVRGETDAVVVIDADAQHPAAAIPTFMAAARDAELVIGDRFDDLRAMPTHRRVANRAVRRLFQLRTGLEVRDTQNGMRLMRGRALDLLPDGGFEAETRHLRHALRAELPIAWVPIPAIYGESRSSFRTGRDSLRVLWAVVQPRE